ncbi:MULTISPECIES: helicase RepA family protein [unclassified Neptuniibacter]|uniref:AAA family ATPase n=1 Tax=unclassified Neptuniibacter TaxID=2630693 RepID=UPI000C48338F|nr:MULTISPECIES: helicase RepA family protein [unclassified Neptuniibacter]MAY41904.1 hypothetical protein [Oceanospirillaceae bacterium]|tara:strand:+ start:2904 stop:3896 length:993 start_codon:yes stop_codon:yes gene_type:complete
MNQFTDYNFIKLDELYSQPLQIDWLVESYIPSDSIGMLFGASGSGKSHIVLSLAVSIANGTEWFGLRAKEGNVLILAGEGNNGLQRRLRAIQVEHEITINPDRIFFSERPIGLDTDTGFDDAVTAIENLDKELDLIVIDTLSRHLLQSAENSNDDMAQFINRLEQLRHTYKCTILVVHHTGKSDRQEARGASALKANIDFSFGVQKDDSRICRLTCDKQKDADDDLPAKHFLIKGVDLGEADSYGNAITGACIVEANEMPSFAMPKGVDYEQLAIDTFNSEKRLWQEAFVEVCEDKSKTDSKKKRFRGVIDGLIKAGRISVTNDDCYEIN